jgi:hypothetical protein
LVKIAQLSKRIKQLQQAIHRGGRKIPVLRGGGNAERPSAPSQDTIEMTRGRLKVGNATEIEVGLAPDSVGEVIPPGTNVPAGRSLLLSSTLMTSRR